MLQIFICKKDHVPLIRHWWDLKYEYSNYCKFLINGLVYLTALNNPKVLFNAEICLINNPLYFQHSIAAFFKITLLLINICLHTVMWFQVFLSNTNDF